MLEKAVHENKADPIKFAYLSDRIAVFEGKAQLYGTQFDWGMKEEMSPNQIDDIEKVNLRRETLGLNSVANRDYAKKSKKGKSKTTS